MPNRQFDIEVAAALDAKAAADLALIDLRHRVNTGAEPYSASALLSAVERCDQAMHVVWEVIKPRVLKDPEK